MVGGKGRNADAVLKDLAARAAVYWKRSQESWIECAYVLLEARQVAGHGEWLPFLADIGLAERTASRMLLIAEAGLKSATVADLGGVAKACEFIAAVGRARKNWTPARDASTGEVAALLGHVEPSAGSILLTGLWQVDLETWSRVEETPRPVADFAAEFETTLAWAKEREEET